MVTCQFKKNGCNEIIKFPDLEEHESKCLFTLYQCICSNLILKNDE
jgi:hypothetical protein